MKNTIKYTRIIRGHEYDLTAHRTKAAARRSIHEAHNPCLVKIYENGETYYDAYPLGHPLPEDAEVIERCVAAGKWRKVEPLSMQEIIDQDARTGRGY